MTWVFEYPKYLLLSFCFASLITASSAQAGANVAGLGLLAAAEAGIYFFGLQEARPLVHLHFAATHSLIVWGFQLTDLAQEPLRQILDGLLVFGMPVWLLLAPAIPGYLNTLKRIAARHL